MSKEQTGPVQTAQRLARRELPKRFYKHVAVRGEGDAFAVTLDGRPARTPLKRKLAAPSVRLAEAIAREWDAQSVRIDPATMPLTRIVNAAIDSVADNPDAVRGEIVKYAGSDLLCYRAEGPAELVAIEEEAWGPLLAFARDRLDARLRVASGIVHAMQRPEAIAAIARAVAAFDPLELTAVSVITTITGSAIIALAIALGGIDADAGWKAAHVDEDWQMRQWGEDSMAMRRRAARRLEYDAAAFILREMRGDGR
ncbi:MAG TPA: ATP12 family protein [Bauldia sp.]|nr:ATP12 family protein [Bauldia sp.]